MHEQHHTHEPVGGPPVNDEDKAICPVTHMDVSKIGTDAQGLIRTYQGETYYFCCNGCTTQFDENPEEYVHAHGGQE
jgi:Cu+-exporting ATPase